MAALAAGIVLSLIANRTLPYEQDQGSKLAVEYKIIKANAYFSPMITPHYYSEEQQPLYYALGAAFMNLVGGSPYGTMNLLSVLLGVVFMTATCYVFNRVHQIACWVTWLVLISMPMFVLTFTFGNEVAAAMALFMVAMAAATARGWPACLGSGLALAACLWSYVPMVLLGPFFLLWVWFCVGDGRRWQERARHVWGLLVAFVIFTVSLWALFVRAFVLPLTSSATAQLLYRMALHVFTPCPTILLLAVIAWVWYIPRRDRIVLCYLAVLLPAAFMPGTISHKHLLVISLAVSLPAALLIQRSGHVWKALCLAGIAVWYVVSITPYGVHAGAIGAGWFMPTNDGPCPTGAYVMFYQNVRSGQYQEQYRDEIYCIERGVDAVEVSHGTVNLAGSFNTHFVFPYLYEKNVDPEGELLQHCRQTTTLDPNQSPVYLIRTSYLRSSYIDARSNKLLDSLLNRGKVRVVDSSDSAIFPAVIESGQTIPDNSNAELGRRILFARKYCANQGMVDAGQLRLLPAFHPLFWVPASTAKDASALPLYIDASFAAFDKDLPGAVAWGLRLPYKYLQIIDPNVENIKAHTNPASDH